MLIPLLTDLHANKDTLKVSMESIYTYVGITRQGFSQQCKRLKSEEAMMSSIAIEVHEYRSDKDRRAGSRSLYYNLRIKEKYQLGVSKFERLMSKYELTLLPLRIRVVTTQSCFSSWSYSDLTPGLKVENINRLVVGDLTYVSIDKYQYYVFCLTDVYSGRIVGISIGKRMRAVDAKQAFDEWVRLRGRQALRDCIHHTDGGSQYFSKLYLGAMNDLQLRISVAKNCLDNGFAEQRNGLLKHHLLPTVRISRESQIEGEVRKIVDYYNGERKQARLGWLSPIDYEKKWATQKQAPRMQIYDRTRKQKTERRGFSEG